MTRREAIKIHSEGIANILKTQKLKVPTYQRSFAWEEQHVRQLLVDLTTAMQNQEQEYFLGSIVITAKGKERPEVVDGQQRLATISILISAIRDYFHKKGENTRVEDIERDFLFSRHRRTQDSEPKLMLNEIDNDFFQKTIISNPSKRTSPVSAMHESHERLFAAATLAKEHIESLVAVNANPTDLLNDLIDYVEGAALAVLVEAADDSNAFIVFETLNDRGLNLSLTDLLKNFLFGRSGKRLSEVQQRWFSTSAILEEEIMITFVRHFWISKKGPTRERDLYMKIKDSITSEKAAIDFATELAESAQIYDAILTPSHEYWDSFTSDVRRSLEAVKLLRLEQIRPLLLAILNTFTPAEVSKSLKLLVSCAVRFLIVGGLGGGTLERHYSETAVKIREGKIHNSNQLASELRSVVPNDKQFVEAFAIASEKRAPFARYYLSVLERVKNGVSDPELVPNEEVEAVNLEHVLPLKPSKEWGHIDPETARAFCVRIGNMALMKTKVNGKVANLGFEKKKSEYAKSGFALTKELGVMSTWATQEIIDRQKRLAELAVKAWPLIS